MQTDSGVAPDSAGPDASASAVSLLLDIDPAELGLPPPPANSLPVRAGFFLSVDEGTPATPWEPDVAATYILGTVRATNDILGQCGLHIELEVAQVISLPEYLMNIQGNEQGSFGGHPPDGTKNPDLFNHEENERLTDDTRELFTYGKQNTSPNAIAAFTVRSIEYYIGDEEVGAGGLSHPPNTYHNVDDYPMRNSVLLVPEYTAVAELPEPLWLRTLAHEIGHMLLNSGLHTTTVNNLMSEVFPGSNVSAEQCECMKTNLAWLFGDEAVPDPGPPAS